MKRIFAAIDVSNEARTQISNYVETLRSEFPELRVGWDKTEKLHITINFFGDVEDRKVLLVSKLFEEISQQISPFKLQITKTGVFPSRRNARVLWLSLQDEKGSLNRINNILESECEGYGFIKEKRLFKPHLTIARLRQPEKSKDLIEKHLQTNFETAGFEVGELTIYESKLHPANSIYSVVSKHEFGKQSVLS